MNGLIDFKYLFPLKPPLIKAISTPNTPSDPHQYTAPYRNSQTTSTKCQYRIDDSRPMWCSAVKWYAIIRKNATAMKIVPIITWNPWNPVEKKKHDPYTPSAIVKSASMYSSPCSAVNIKANTIVSATPPIAARRFPSISAWCAYVTVAKSFYSQ